MVRVSVPVAVAQMQLPKILPAFLDESPKVRLQLHVNNRRVDIINEGYDVALRVRAKLDDDGSLVMRSFGQIQELLVASPKYLNRAGRPKMPEDLAEHVTLSISEDEARQRWELHGPDGEVRRIELNPRLAGFDFPLLQSMAKKDGFGITLLPETVCAEAVRKGELEVVLPEWSLPQGICHAVFASRRGMLPAVRVFIDFLAEHLPQQIESSRLDCGGKCSEEKDKAIAMAIDNTKAAKVEEGLVSHGGGVRAKMRHGLQGAGRAAGAGWRCSATRSRAVPDNGEMAERFKAPVLKTGEGSNLPWVRIPLSPPLRQP